MQIIKYNGTKAEMDRLISEKQALGYVLTDVQNVTEGNFLGFKEPGEVQTVGLTDLESKLDQIIVSQTEIKAEIKAVKP